MARKIRINPLLLAVLVAFYAVLAAAEGGYWEGEGKGWGGGEAEEGEESWSRQGADWFLLQDSRHVVKTEAGDMRVVRGDYGGGRGWMRRRAMHIGFITMEPHSLFIPQYLDSSLILFIRRGEARLGHIYKDDLAEKRLKTGDVYRIPAGSAFYLVNTAEGQRLHVICSIDTSEALGWASFQSFYIGGGRYPASILSGFDPVTLSTAFNVTTDEVREVLTRQQSGPIIYLSDSNETVAPRPWADFLEMDQQHRLAHLKRVVHFEEEETRPEQNEPTWSFTNFLRSLLFGREEEENRDDKGSRNAPDSYNIYDAQPGFRNNYGWSIALDESDYPPLSDSGIGVYLVNLTAGSMMAPHVNPSATEFGVVLRGSGNIQIVFPNGSLAMNARVGEGDVFRIPRFFPFCQIASRTGPFEFFGFTTSSRRNRPQFLVGANSVLQTMRGPEFAAALGVDEERLRILADSQRESVILPSAPVSPPDEAVEVIGKETSRKNVEMKYHLKGGISGFGGLDM